MGLEITGNKIYVTGSTTQSIIEDVVMSGSYVDIDTITTHNSIETFLTIDPSTGALRKTNSLNGDPGHSGPQGSQGNQGGQGPTGYGGRTGNTGNSGYGGRTGNTGIIGATPSPGPQGSQGNQGVQGYGGFTGPTGGGGSQGTQGPQGYQGIRSNVGNLSYNVYSTHFGNGNTSDYINNGFTNYPLNAPQFDILLNTNQAATQLVGSGTIAVNTGIDFVSYTTLTAAGVPVPNSGNYYSFEVFGTFVPTTTGTYNFSCETDDSGELYINNTFVCGFYGGRGTPPIGTTTGTISLTAGVAYNFNARMQEYAGGDGLRVYWQKPGSSTWQIDANELFNDIGGRNVTIGGQGSQGSQGNQGRLGYQGPQGSQGYQGGNNGYRGSQGGRGGQGSQGYQGIRGPEPRGSQGSQGFQGYQGGNQGGQGGQGGRGSQGPQGFQGTSPTGLTGPTGYGGITGHQGGNQGPQGGQGGRGSQGPQGYQGTSPTSRR